MKRTTSAAFCFALTALLSVAVPALQAQKRPLTHADYDGWRHIQNQHLSDDGHFLAYAVFPQEGDGELVVRNLVTGKEFRESIGQLPPPPPANFATNTEDGPPPQRGIDLAFSHDSRWLVFSTFPTRAAMEESKRDKKKPQPKNGLRILELSSNSITRVERVKSFQVPSQADGFVAFLREGEPAPPPAPAAVATPRTPRKEYGTELVLRNLGTGTDRAFADVAEYTLTKDAKLLAYAVSSKTEESNGVYSVTAGSQDAPRALMTGKGKYSKLAWDEKQTGMAFLGGPQTALCYWKRDDEKASQLASTASAGFPSGTVISDRANVSFSKDGRRIFFGYAPKAMTVKPDDTPAEDRVAVDLWHWKDDYIQPMQKVRATLERNKSYRAAYLLDGDKIVPIADGTMAEASPSDDGRYSIGGDDRAYRAMREYDDTYVDSYLVDNQTGSRKLVSKRHLGRVTWSPAGNYALFFDGQDWNTISVPEGKVVNITASLGVKFSMEEHDSPGAPRPYGIAGWTKDGKSVILNDRYDLWQVSPDASAAKNITKDGRKTHIAYRYVRLDNDPEDKGIDPTKSLLLRAENSESHDTGFFKTTMDAGAPPQKLMMAAKSYSMPIKAKNADVLALTEATFAEFPDLRITDLSFKELRKVSDANPQQAGILWGTAELVHFKNVDGVPLNATLYKPENFDASKRYPMIVYIYERLSENVNAYVEPRPMHTINVSYYVSNGYLVLEPDIAYKIGFPGQSALQCVLPAVQTVVDKGFVNEDAIGIQGHSWGGYQIAYMVTQTNRFKAVAAGAPVANMTSAYDGIRWGPGIPRQFQYEKTQSRIGGSLWEYPMRYLENSPIFMADRVKTPILMIHNDADDAVPWYQGIEYFLALRRLGKEAYLFSYNGEPHGLRRRPNQKDYARRMQEYFDYYLKGAPKPDWMVRGIPYLEKPGVAPSESDQ